jgi:hypothetical protein
MMENIISLETIHNLDPIYKKKVTPKKGTTTYTVVSVDFVAPTKCKNDTPDNSSVDDTDDAEDETHLTPPPLPSGRWNPYKYSPNIRFRSVVLNEDETQLLSFSPPKSIPLNEFKEIYQRLDLEQEDPFWLGTKRFVINEIIEGTMVNLWWDYSNNKWEISTKKSVSGNYIYSKTPSIPPRESHKTFKEMFIEIVGNYEEFGGDNETLNLNKNHFYSFVMKHPDNHFVHSVTKPEIYLVAVYQKTGEWEVKYIPPAVFKEWGILTPQTVVKYPISFGFDPMSLTSSVYTYGDITATIDKKNQHVLNSFNNKLFNHYGATNYTMGVMITDIETGYRTKVENTVYTYLKELRGNHPSYKYKYYELVFTGRLYEFVYYFPRYAELFMEFQREFDTFIYNIYNYYVSKFILKNIAPEESHTIPTQFRYHVNNLHYTVYIPSLKSETRRVINIHTVYEYVWKLPIKSILFWLNYEKIMAKKNKKIAVANSADDDRIFLNEMNENSNSHPA